MSRANFRHASRSETPDAHNYSLRSVLVGLDVVVLYHLAPGLHLVAEKGTLNFGAAEGQRYLLGFDQLLCNALLAQGRRHLVPEALDDLLWRAGRREYAPPGVGFETRKALGHCRYLRDKLIAFLPGLRNWTNCSCVHLRHR